MASGTLAEGFAQRPTHNTADVTGLAGRNLGWNQGGMEIVGNGAGATGKGVATGAFPQLKYTTDKLMAVQAVPVQTMMGCNGQIDVASGTEFSILLLGTGRFRPRQPQYCQGQQGENSRPKLDSFFHFLTPLGFPNLLDNLQRR